VIGTGNVGGALGRRWAQAGHQVVFGTRDATSNKVLALLVEAGENARASTPPEAVEGAEVVVLATPWEVTETILGSLGDLSGTILIDCTNPLRAGLAGLTVGGETSGGEQVAAWAPGARVVKAFNTTGSRNMADPDYGVGRIVMPIAGDDEEAKASVMGLAEELGFEPVDVGPLTQARYLEPMALLWITLAYVQGLGPNFGFALLRRE